ncbi:MAG: hypothetical protein IJW86_04935 [Clostridia bacterium]|nr:hypothetical protein [Clostridia bacterium]
MLDKLRKFMYGRYGNDQLNLALVIFGCVLTLFLSFFDAAFIRYLGLIPYIVAACRMLSKNIAKRQQENLKFLKISAPWRQFIIKKVKQFQDKDHKYYQCPKCHNTLRVPKGRGKIKISCPHCSTEFIKKT